MQRVHFWCLFGATLCVYAAMLGWSLPTVSAAADNLPPFDMRPSGYSFAEAEAFLAALTPAGTSFYRHVQQRLDLVYPALIALTLLFAIVALLPRRWVSWRWLAVPAVLPVAVFDYLENHVVAQMIEGGADRLTPELAAEASHWTVLKSGATTLAMTVLLVLLLARGGAALVRLVRRARAPAQAAA